MAAAQEGRPCGCPIEVKMGKQTTKHPLSDANMEPVRVWSTFQDSIIDITNAINECSLWWI